MHFIKTVKLGLGLGGDLLAADTHLVVDQLLSLPADSRSLAFCLGIGGCDSLPRGVFGCKDSRLSFGADQAGPLFSFSSDSLSSTFNALAYALVDEMLGRRPEVRDRDKTARRVASKELAVEHDVVGLDHVEELFLLPSTSHGDALQVGTLECFVTVKRTRLSKVGRRRRKRIRKRIWTVAKGNRNLEPSLAEAGIWPSPALGTNCVCVVWAVAGVWPALSPSGITLDWLEPARGPCSGPKL